MKNVRSVAVLISLITILSIDAQSQINKIPDNIELQVLKDLFDSLGGRSWTNKTNWPSPDSWPSSATSAQFGTWFGVVVNNGDIGAIMLNGNNLTGHLPASIKYLTRLISFEVANNNLSGKLPPAWCELASLCFLRLEGNRLTGEIPPCLENLRSLRTLWLSNNAFSGKLPEIFGKMVELRDLRLANTQLTGPLPASLGLPGSPLYRLITTGNRFTGPIPSSWANLTALRELYLNQNDLSGELPSTIGNWVNLISMVINGNRFTGDFPSTVGNIKSLSALVASNNYFTSIPSSLLSQPGMTIIHFDGNDLTSIPDFGSYVNRANLVLKLENNRLDFSQLERNVGRGIKTLTQIPQKTINDNTTRSFSIGDKFILLSRPATPNTTVTWEKLGPNGVSWSVLTNDEDNAADTYSRNVSSALDAGTYRWKTTNSVLTGTTIQSDPIVVKARLGFQLDNWCFQYKYDERGRMTHKKMPGADWVCMVYDDRNRLVMTQDGELRKSNKWIVTKYDQLNRPVVIAVYTHAAYASQQDMSNLISKALFTESYSGTGISGYTNTVFPTTNLEVLKATYYDDYSFASGNTSLRYKGDQLVGQYQYHVKSSSSFPFVLGMVTGTKVKVLDMPYYMTTVNYYDDKGHVVQTVAETYDVGTDRTTNAFDFRGKTISSRTTHSADRLHWQNLSMMTFDGNLAKRTSSGYAGGSSVEYIPESNDGWAEATSTETNTRRYFGLSATDPDLLPNSINYCFSLDYSTLSVMENGIIKQSMPNLIPGERLRISRTGSIVRYYRNGALIYTSTIPSTSLLRLDVTLLSTAATLLNLNLSAAERTTTSALREFTYDHAGRLIATRHAVNGNDTVLLSKNQYNMLGQLVDKKLHRKPNGSFSQSIDYRYNIRGWLTSLNGAAVDDSYMNDGDRDASNDLFGINLQYDDRILGLGNVSMFNGNVSAMQWRADLGLGDTKVRAYTFGYDPMNRFLNSNGKAFSSQWRNESAYFEDSLQYDLNGNIMRLRRADANGSIVDKLYYGYGTGNTRGNQLLRVKDNADPSKGFSDGVNIYDDYGYDRNGNMATDNNNGIVVTYNILNLPANVSRKGQGTIQYYYDALGRKLSQVVKDGLGVQKKKTDYHGDFIYENDSAKFANTDEGRVVLTGNPEYQYDLKDHLGNVRMTFTTKDEVVRSVASFEMPTADFLNYNATVKVNSELFDHTNSGVTYYSERLNGSLKEQFGLAKSLSVMPGDTVKMEVFAKYLDTNSSNWSAALNSLMASVSNGTASPGVFVDGSIAGDAVIPWSGFLDKGTDTGPAPKAYLNYLVFDRNYKFIGGEAIRVSTDAREYGQDGSHQRLSRSVLIRQAGYLYLYLSNDNVAMGGQPVDVYFDDLKVEHVKSPIVQSQDYYPFGLVFNSYQREDQPVNKFMFQSQEHIDDLGLNWDSFKWRNHMPEIGRFFNIDPIAEKYVYYSPYTFSGNRIINARELEGLEPLVLFGSKDEAAKNFGEFYNDNSIRRNEEYGSMIYSTTVNGTTMYGYSIANIGTGGASVTISDAPEGTTVEGDIHTHAAYSPRYLNNVFSGIPQGRSLATSRADDIGGNNRLGVDGYVVTPNGSLQKYDVKAGTITTISTSMPSDPKDPTRLNKVSPTPSTSTYTTQEGDTLMDLAKRFDTTEEAISNENGITDPKKVKTGTLLKITN